MFKTDTYRLIRKTFKRFFSLLMIVLIGSGFMMGLFSTPTIMRQSVDVYDDEYHLADIQLLSPYGFCRKDIGVLMKTEGVENVLASRFRDVYLIEEDGEKTVARFEEIYRKVNRLKLTEGRMPKKDDEVLLLANINMAESFSLGDEIEIYLEDRDVKEDLTYDHFTIVGFADCPLYMARTLGASTLNNEDMELVIFANNNIFRSEYYSTVYLTLEGSEKTLSYSKEYDDFIDSRMTDIENVAAEQQSYHRDNIVSEYEEELNSKIEEFNEKKAEGQQELDDAKRQLDDANIRIISTEAEIEVLKNTISSLKIKLDSYLELLEADLEERGIPSDIFENEELIKEYISALSGEREALILELYDEAKDIYEDTQKDLNRAQYELEKGKKEYEEGLSEYAEALKTFNDEVEKAEAEINRARQDLEALPEAQWIILGRDSINSTYMYDATCKQMSAIGYALPVLFYLVAALVCMTTMTRLIDEQRGQIGIFRALGFSRKQITAKYTVYAFLASMTGSVAGILFGQLLFPTVIYRTWRLMYYLPEIRISYPLGYVIICISAFTLLICGITVRVTGRSLDEEPSALMRPKAPKSVKETFIEKIGIIWEKLSFTSKITARNLIRYRSRFFMTVLGVAGCMGLLIVGYGIKDSISDVIEIQFSRIFGYEYQIMLENDHHLDENIKILEDDLSNEIVAPFMSYTTRVYFTKEEKTANLLVF
ncbi:MAG: FtsX-like permease family protein, partial [Erysipelotrichaceae bacterium]|nr:FtsX-like permease family protein [Erysipelotrichaceae bacterium]